MTDSEITDKNGVVKGIALNYKGSGCAAGAGITKDYNLTVNLECKKGEATKF